MTSRWVTLLRVAVSVFVTITIFKIEPALGIDFRKHLSQLVSANWQNEDGLPQNSVHTLLQTKDGYIWLGNLEGLARFDGVRFTVFNRGNTPDFPHDQINALMETKEGVLWAGTYGGLVEYVNGSFKVYGKERGITEGRVLAVAEDKKGVIWATTFTGEVFRLKPNAKDFTPVFSDLIPATTHNCMVVDKDNQLWIGTMLGLVRIQEGDIINKYDDADGLPGINVTALYIDKKDNLWVGTDKGLVRWQNGPAEVFTQFEEVEEITGDRNGNLWIGTKSSGLFAMNGRDIKHYTTADGLSANSIASLLEDKEGSLWVGTNENGLDRFSEGKMYTITRQSGLPADNVWTIHGNGKGRIWFGTTTGLAYLENDVVHALDPKEGAPDGEIMPMLEDRSGVLWFALNGKGLGRMEKGVFRYYGPEQGLTGVKVRSIFEDSKGRLWVGTRQTGLFLYENDTFKHFTTTEGLADQRVCVITEDSDGTLYFGTDGGFSIWRDGKLSTIKYDSNAAGLDMESNAEFQPPQIQSTEFDDEGGLWLGTLNLGIGHYKDGKFRFVLRRDGLPFDTIYSVLDDMNGRLWFAGNKGLGYVEKKQLRDFFAGKIKKITPALFDEADGMKSRECNGGSQWPRWRDKNGLLYFANIRGVVVIDPANLASNELPPPVHIENVSSDGRPIKEGESLPPGSARLDFQYTGLSYISPGRVRFKYKLEGFDNSWVDAGKERIARYTNLSPGSYRFRVIACNNDEVWNEEGAQFSFSLIPRFYERTWFILLVGFGLISFGAAAFWIRYRFVKKREKELSDLAWQRTKGSLERQIVRVKDVASEINEISINLSSSMSQLATVSNLVSGSVTQTANAVEELRIVGERSEQQAEKIVKSSAQVRDTAHQGRLSVEESKKALGEMEKEALDIASMTEDLLERLARVDTIVGTLTSIAEQSQVLAINGAIESAGAGQFGAGFAVVAREMSELAMESRESSYEVTSLLTHVARSIENIAKTAQNSKSKMVRSIAISDHSGTVVEDLGRAVAINNKLADEIVVNISEQAAGLADISKEISKISGTSSQNLSVSRELEDGAKRLAGMVERLLEMINEWQTPELHQ